MPDNLVTVAEFGSPMEAYLLRTRLSEDGIEGFIIDENIPLWLAPIGAGGFSVKLQVRESDKTRALEIIKHPGQED